MQPVNGHTTGRRQNSDVVNRFPYDNGFLRDFFLSPSHFVKTGARAHTRAIISSASKTVRDFRVRVDNIHEIRWIRLRVKEFNYGVYIVFRPRVYLSFSVLPSKFSYIA